DPLTQKLSEFFQILGTWKTAANSDDGYRFVGFQRSDDGTRVICRRLCRFAAEDLASQVACKRFERWIVEQQRGWKIDSESHAQRIAEFDCHQRIEAQFVQRLSWIDRMRCAEPEDSRGFSLKERQQQR